MNGVPENSERRGSITKVGVPAIRRIIVEMVWRMILFQPQYKPVQKWQDVLRGSNPALKKKAVVAIGAETDGRSVAAGNWPSDGPRTQSGDDRRRRSLKVLAESHFQWGSAANPVFGGNLLF